jgi:predicted RNA binding protein YcfA (HicA-like mRNA interferase family)
MTQVPILKPKDVVKALTGLGWEVARQRGSHIILVKENHPASLSVPNHAEVARGTLRALLDRAGVSLDEFLAALKR